MAAASEPHSPTPAISVDISGSGDVTIDGTADDQAVTISGSGNYTAGDLATLTSTATVSGSGNVSVSVRDVFEAEINGSGNVTYSGSPQVSQDISGSGDTAQGMTRGRPVIPGLGPQAIHSEPPWV